MPAFASAVSWTPCPAAPPAVAADEVHVWWGALTGEHWWEPLLPLLSDDERERAAHMRRAEDRLRAQAGRALARALLGACGAGRPEGLRFVTGAHGKPHLATNPRDLHFNIAHSGDAVLVAVALAREVGVDVEQLRNDLGADTGGICAPAEATALAQLAPSRRQAGFFACWTRKEAYLKARGDGLAMEPAGFAVTVDPDAPPALLTTPHDPDDVRRWTLAALPPIPGHAAAVAARGGGWRLHGWRVQGVVTSEAWLAGVE